MIENGGQTAGDVVALGRMVGRAGREWWGMSDPSAARVSGGFLMPEQPKDGSGSAAPREDLLTYVCQTMRENEGVLYRSSKETYSEVVGFINDAVDSIGAALKRGATPESYARYAVLYCLIHVLMPVGGAIYINALGGNLPACFMELRLALESLVKCYLADSHYPGRDFFQDRLHSLEKDKKSISALMKQLDADLGLEEGSIGLWRALSEDWVHTKGIMDGIVGHLVERSDAPAWGLVIPRSYRQEDLSSLDELRKRLAQFRCLLKHVMQEYYKRVSFS